MEPAEPMSDIQLGPSPLPKQMLVLCEVCQAQLYYSLDNGGTWKHGDESDHLAAPRAARYQP